MHLLWQNIGLECQFNIHLNIIIVYLGRYPVYLLLWLEEAYFQQNPERKIQKDYFKYLWTISWYVSCNRKNLCVARTGREEKRYSVFKKMFPLQNLYYRVVFSRTGYQLILNTITSKNWLTGQMFINCNTAISAKVMHTNYQ